MKPEELQRQVRAFYEKAQQSLNGMIDALPESLRGQLSELKASLNQALEKLPPMDQVPAANDAAYAFNYMVTCLARYQELSEKLMTSLNDMVKQYSGQALSVNGKLTEFEQKISTGELLTKEQAKEMADAARRDGEAQARTQLTAVSNRKTVLAQCGMPVPVDEAILVGTDEEFNAKKELAANRIKELTGKHASLNGSPALARLAWADEDTFKRDAALLDEVLKSGRSNNGNGKSPEPALGGNPGAGANGGGKRIMAL